VTVDQHPFRILSALVSDQRGRSFGPILNAQLHSAWDGPELTANAALRGCCFGGACAARIELGSPRRT
jgi:hypothetical protein